MGPYILYVFYNMFYNKIYFKIHIFNIFLKIKINNLLQHLTCEQNDMKLNILSIYYHMKTNINFN